MKSSRSLIIEPGASDNQYWRDVWNFRALFYALVLRDVSVRYKQTVLGVMWALIRPLLTMIVFTIVFGNLAKLPPHGTSHYALMVYIGLLPWYFFSNGLSDASTSLLDNSNLISKVYFPRIIIPLASILTSFFDFLIGFLLLIVLLIWYGVSPGLEFLTLPLFALLTFAACSGLSLWIASINVKYRDFRYVVPFFVQVGFYISPVGFSSSVVPENWRMFFSLNPMVGIINGFRWAILGEKVNIIPELIMSLIVTTFFVWFGIKRFRSLEKSFADFI